jgi:hypothetical protein
MKSVGQRIRKLSDEWVRLNREHPAVFLTLGEWKAANIQQEDNRFKREVSDGTIEGKTK